MSEECESHCPICRHPYYHFPTISQTLHFLLLKLYPIAYRRREEQTLEEEKEMGAFSRQFDSNSHQSQDNKENERNNHPDPSSNISESKSQSNPRSPGNKEPNGSGNQLSIADVECSSWKRLLYRPVFLNCGYCETCISSPDAEGLKCQLCPSMHPTGMLKVCLELDHFLEKKFPAGYASRREAVQLKQVQIKNKNSIENTVAVLQSSKIDSLELSGLKMHPGFGWTIVGYECIDCDKNFSFDLCGNCYNSGPKLPGRFNPQHTPEHKLILVDLDSPTDTDAEGNAGNN